MEISLPTCLKCEKGVLVPLSDYGRDGASIHYKAWACSNPDCGFNIRIDNGELSRKRNKEIIQIERRLALVCGLAACTQL